MTARGPLTGSTLGNFVLGELLDHGGVGSVYVAEHRFFGERAAVKVLHEQPANSNAADIAQRFFQEARATRSIDHPNVIKVYDFGQTDAGVLYLAMELLEGISIAHVLEHGAVEERSAAFIAAAVASGLHAAHDKGIIHRDLKPANIFVCKSGAVKLLDFGMAKVKEGKVRTGVGMLAGTPHYMSPEQIRQDGVGPRADIYGLGAVLFKMLTRRLPFESTSLLEIVKMHLNEPPPKPSQHARVSERMDAIVLACLAKDPAARPSSMVELREMLQPIAEPVGAEQLTRAASVALTERRPERREGGRWIGLVGVAAVATLVGAGLALLRPWVRAQSHAAAPVEQRRAAPAAPPAGVPSAAPAPETEIVSVQSDPPGAHVFADHVPRGVAPIDLTVKLPFELKLELDGYRTIRRKITRAGAVRIKLAEEPAELPPPPPQKQDAPVDNPSPASLPPGESK